MNYLHSRISEVRGTYRRRGFDMKSYHTFITHSVTIMASRQVIKVICLLIL